MNGSFCKKVVSKAKVALNFSHFESPSMKKINFRLSRKNKTVDFAKNHTVLFCACHHYCCWKLLFLLFRSKKTRILIELKSRYYNRKYVIYYCNQKLDVRKNDSSPEFFPSWLYSPPTKLIVILCAVPFQDRSTEKTRYIYTTKLSCAFYFFVLLFFSSSP